MNGIYKTYHYNHLAILKFAAMHGLSAYVDYKHPREVGRTVLHLVNKHDVTEYTFILTEIHAEWAADVYELVWQAE